MALLDFLEQRISATETKFQNIWRKNYHCYWKIGVVHSVSYIFNVSWGSLGCVTAKSSIFLKIDWKKLDA